MSEEFTPERLAHIEYELNCMRAELKELKDKNATLIEENKLMIATIEKQTAYVNGIMDARPRMSDELTKSERWAKSNANDYRPSKTKRDDDRKSSWLDDAVTISTSFSSAASGLCGGGGTEGGGGSSSSW